MDEYGRTWVMSRSRWGDYDDGSLQAWLDEEYGTGLVRMVSLVPAGRKCGSHETSGAVALQSRRRQAQEDAVHGQASNELGLAEDQQRGVERHCGDQDRDLWSAPLITSSPKSSSTAPPAYNGRRIRTTSAHGAAAAAHLARVARAPR